MLDLSPFDGKEVFIVIDGDETDSAEVMICSEAAQLYHTLAEFDSNTGGDVRAYHGMLCSAKYLPPVLNKSGSVFIIEVDTQGYHNEGYVFESASANLESLMWEIEAEIQNSNPPIDIDHVFILYGYQLSLCLSIMGDVLDEEIIDTCKKTRETIDEIKYLMGGCA